LPQIVLADRRPRRVFASSMTSSWKRLAVWRNSMTVARG
jgi:hypothetical protein